MSTDAPASPASTAADRAASVLGVIGAARRSVHEATLSALGVTIPVETDPATSHEVRLLADVAARFAREQEAGGADVALPPCEPGESLAAYRERLELEHLRTAVGRAGIATGGETEYEVRALYEAHQAARLANRLRRPAGQASIDDQRGSNETVRGYVERVTDALVARSPAHADVLRATIGRVAARTGAVRRGVYAISTDSIPTPDAVRPVAPRRRR